MKLSALLLVGTLLVPSAVYAKPNHKHPVSTCVKYFKGLGGNYMATDGWPPILPHSAWLCCTATADEGGLYEWQSFYKPIPKCVQDLNMDEYKVSKDHYFGIPYVIPRNN